MSPLDREPATPTRLRDREWRVGSSGLGIRRFAQFLGLQQLESLTGWPVSHAAEAERGDGGTKRRRPQPGVPQSPSGQRLASVLLFCNLYKYLLCNLYFR